MYHVIVAIPDHVRNRVFTSVCPVDVSHFYYCGRPIRRARLGLTNRRVVCVGVTSSSSGGTIHLGGDGPRWPENRPASSRPAASDQRPKQQRAAGPTHLIKLKHTPPPEHRWGEITRVAGRETAVERAVKRRRRARGGGRCGGRNDGGTAGPYRAARCAFPPPRLLFA